MTTEILCAECKRPTDVVSGEWDGMKGHRFSCGNAGCGCYRMGLFRQSAEPDYQSRVRLEAQELEAKINALTAFMVTPAYHSIDRYDAALLRNQQRAMRAYLDVLLIRIARFK